MSSRRKVIALVPVKNESYLIASFLKLTLSFADWVIIADQDSSDETVEICRRFANTSVIFNRSRDFDNAERASLLISEARARFGIGHLLLAVDADELAILTEEAKREIDYLRSLSPGTTVYFDKPTLVGSPHKWIRYGSVFPLGFVDDGSAYFGNLFHSRRIPQSTKGAHYHCSDLSFLHLDSLSMDAMLAKRRLYSIRERDAGTIPLHVRWRRNSEVFVRELERKAWDTPDEVIRLFSRAGIALDELKRPRPYWWDREALKRFQQHGFKKYYWDDVWNVPWEEKLLDYPNEVGGSLPSAIRRPPEWINRSRNCLIHMLKNVLNLKGALKRMASKLSLDSG